MKSSKRDFYNKSGYADPTAYEVIKKENELEDKVDNLIRILKCMIRLSGFELVGRIAVKDISSGKIFR